MKERHINANFGLHMGSRNNTFLIGDSSLSFPANRLKDKLEAFDSKPFYITWNPSEKKNCKKIIIVGKFYKFFWRLQYRENDSITSPEKFI